MALLEPSADGRRKIPETIRIGPYIVDFACPSLKIVIELDGGHHSVQTSDKVRGEWLESQGYTVLRFWNNEVLGATDAVVDKIFNTLR